MAAILFTAIGAAVGTSVIGGAIGAVAGRLVGGLIGTAIDSALSPTRTVEGPRLKDLDVLSSTEGAAIPRVYGRMRVAGEVIWATKLEETRSTRSSGGKGLAGGGGKTRQITYSYFANFAVGLCEGPIARIGRIWADGKELDQRGLTIRFYQGTEWQAADPLIIAKQGAEGAPAYRGLAYVVFERLPLANFGNRIPQLSFEVTRVVGRAEAMARAMVMIPGSTEFGYDPVARVAERSDGVSTSENRHLTLATADFVASLDELRLLCPNLQRVALVVAWFGTDLRAGQCQIVPGVQSRTRTVSGATWLVAGQTRETAYLVSTFAGKPAYGGSPDDRSVIAAIQEMKSRGLKVTLIPFVMMDVPQGNALPDPWTGAASQPPYPWRGRITVDPAPERPGTADGTAAAASQIAAFVGTAKPFHFTSGGAGGAAAIAYSAPAEWSYSRFVLHAAKLAQAAGGVDTFAIGSEMVALTRARSAPGIHPFVDALTALAADVKTMLPAAILTYAADWTEYGARVIGSEVRFPLDKLWADPNIGAVGIDFYPPLADDRGATPARDAAEFRAALRSGEAFDWYYADDAARLAGTRAPISDGLGKPWVFRQKDLVGWWSNAHAERIGGVETGNTPWVPRAKPIYLMEFGVAAVDRGANRPSAFPDPKSIENALPPFSSGARDDLVQRRAIEGVLAGFDPAFGATTTENPVSEIYGGRMVDPSHIQLWCWDARPWPAFPRMRDEWGDGPNWETGHWLNGRFGGAPLSDAARAMLEDFGVTDADTSGVAGVVDGAYLDKPMRARDALEPLADAFGFHALERDGVLVLRTLPEAEVANIDAEDCVAERDQAVLSLTRLQERDLPRELTLAYNETDADFRASAVTARRLTGGSRRVATQALAVSSDSWPMQAAAEVALHRAWAGRDRAAFAVPPSMLALEPGDVVSLSRKGRAHRLRVHGLEGDGARRAEAASISAAVRPTPPIPSRRAYDGPVVAGPPVVAILDLPALTEAGDPPLSWLAAAAAPWAGPMTVWRGDGTSFEAFDQLTLPSTMGVTTSAFAPGPVWRWDRARTLDVRLVAGVLAGLPESQVLSGDNAAAIKTPSGGWEVFQYRVAELIGERAYRLSVFLRGQRGTEPALQPVPAGATIVFLDGPLVALGAGLDLPGRPFVYRVGRDGEDLAGPLLTQVSAAATARALLPPTPVRLRARREAAGVRVSWIRRARFGGDSWELAEIPLGEANEAYRVEVIDDAGLVVRAAEVVTPTWLYASADEIADFGAPRATIQFAVAQRSAIAGFGARANATIAL